MSDFDKILREKLNEEDSFPRMDQNWQKLANRMATSDSPAKHLRPVRTAWKWAVAAAGLVLVATNVWWWYDHSRAKHESIDAVSQQQNKANIPDETQTDIENKAVVLEPNNARKNAELVSPKSKDIEMPVISQDNITSNIPSVKQPNLGAKTPISTNKTLENTVPNKNIVNSTPSVKQPNLDDKIPVLDNKTVKNEPIAGVNGEIKKGDTPLNQANETTKIEDAIVSNKEGNKNEPVANTEKNNQEPIKSDNNIDKTNTNKLTESVANTPETPIKDDKNQAIETPKQDAVAVAETPKVSNIDLEKANKDVKNAENATTAEEQAKKEAEMAMKPIIQPFKWKPKFSVGVNGIVASPIGNNLSVLRGFGASLGMVISENLRFDIVGTLSELEYKLSEHKPRWKIPRDPRSPGGPLPNPVDIDLRKIDGHQERRQLGVNLAYSFKTNGWITPKLEVGYAWQRISSQTAKFEFRDRRTGADIYTIEILEPQSLKNLWNVGIGAEKAFGHFTADVSAAFQKDMSNASVDFMVFRGGVRYNF